MSRYSRSDRLNKGTKPRPKRRAAAKSHFFKYQLANNPNRAEEIELKRALEESLRSQQHSKVGKTTTTATTNGNQKRTTHNNNASNDVVIISSTNSSDVSHTNSSGSSNESLGIITRSNPTKRTRSSTPLTPNSQHTLLIVNNTIGSSSGTSSSSTKRSRSSISPANSCASSPSVINTRSSNITNSTAITNTKSNISSRSNSNINNSSKNNNLLSISGEQLKRNKCDNNNRSLRQLTSTTSTTTRSPLSLSTPSPLPSLSSQNTTTNNTSPRINTKHAMKTYSRQHKLNGATPVTTKSLNNTTNGLPEDCASTSSQVSKSTQTSPAVDAVNFSPTLNSANITTGNQRQLSPADSSRKATTNGSNQKPCSQESSSTTQEGQNHYLKFKRESKNYAYVKMTALKVSTSKMPSNNAKTHSKKSPPGNLSNGSHHSNPSPKANGRQEAPTNRLSSVQHHSNNYHARDNTMSDSFRSISDSNISVKGSKAVDSLSAKSANANSIKSSKHSSKTSCASAKKTTASIGSKSDLSDVDDHDLSKGLGTNVKVAKKRLPPGSWTLLGVPEEKVIYLRDDEPPRRMICYPAIKHIEGDVIQVRDSVLLRSGARKTDLPYIAKICALWEDAETGGIMMSLFWYYRPEHTEEGRKPHHLPDEIFASRHRDVDSVECIEDKCYVLTFNEYCRYRKRLKMEQVNTTWSLADVTIPVSNESYHRRNRIPDSDINPELVFCCRQIYDSRTRRLLKNPLINPKYGHI